MYVLIFRLQVGAGGAVTGSDMQGVSNCEVRLVGRTTRDLLSGRCQICNLFCRPRGGGGSGSGGGLSDAMLHARGFPTCNFLLPAVRSVLVWWWWVGGGGVEALLPLLGGNNPASLTSTLCTVTWGHHCTKHNAGCKHSCETLRNKTLPSSQHAT